MSTEAPIRIVVRDFYAVHGVRVAVADLATLGRAVRPRLRQKLGGHADEHETSLVLAIEPDAVRMERAEADYGHAQFSVMGKDMQKRVGIPDERLAQWCFVWHNSPASVLCEV